MRIRSFALSAAIGAALAAAPLTASAITIEQTVATWSDALGGTDVVYNQANGTYTDVRWGESTGSGQSGLGFDPVNPPAADYGVDTIFKLGDLRHYNNPIFGAASQVDLGLATTITSATPSTQLFSFRFFIDETPNQTPCAYPSTTPCADRITFTNIDLTSAFSIGGLDYTIALIGFSNDGENILSFFDSQEGGTNTTGLYARITQAQKVPEPATALLLGFGLLGLAASRRRHRR